MWTLDSGLLAEELAPVVPNPVLAEAWRGGSCQASLSRLLAMCDVEPMSEDQARAVGVLAGKARHDDIVVVTVVEGAVRGDAVVTSNGDHIRRLASDGTHLRIEPSELTRWPGEPEALSAGGHLEPLRGLGLGREPAATFGCVRSDDLLALGQVP